MNEKITQIKTHVTKHKKAYLVTGAVVAAGACVGVGYILGQKTVPQNADTILNNDPAIKQLGLIWKSPPTIITEIHIEALGDPGNVIQDVTTGTIYASQNQAAQALGASNSMVTRHLQGLRETVNGHTLVNLGKAQVSNLAE